MSVRLKRILNEDQKAIAQDLFAKSSFIEALLATDPEAESTIQVDHSYCNLARMWSQT